jgi:pimeloyl-ACP methyl ester carboxylesterase
MDIQPYKIHIEESLLVDLKRRLHHIRWPRSLDAVNWDEGSSLAFMARLAGYWQSQFDWRAQEARLNRLPQFGATIDGLSVHFVHQRGIGPAPLPLIVTHGWPGSFVEMENILPLLTDPGAHGGDPSDAFHVVVPSLPGYGFSQAPERRGFSSSRVAELWLSLMSGLGYTRFGAQGGDVGAGVSMWLARRFPESIVGFHLNYVSAGYRPPLGEGAPSVTAEEQSYLDVAAAWAATEGAYAHMHGTKPQTLAYSLNDSPVGLAAWIVEKFRALSDCDGDIERIFSLDALLTDISLYWFSGTVDSAIRIYRENRLDPLHFQPGERVKPPVGVALFPHELPMPPRSWVERCLNVSRWTEMQRGGHFAAMEQPELLVEDIRAFFRPLRSATSR